MSKVERVACKKCPGAIGPYVHATKFGNQVWVSGNIGIDKEGKFVGETVVDQARQALENLKNIVEEAGSKMDNVTTIFLVDIKDYPAVNKVYAEYFKEPNFPARSCVAVKQLPKLALVEIEAMAVITK